MDIINSLVFMLNEMSPYILLGFFIAGIMHAFIPRTLFARHLSGTGWQSVVKSAMIGIPLPLCSCGVLPTAIGMRRNGASRAATTSFLVSTPQTGVDSITATWSLLGPAYAVVRPVAALVTAVAGGIAVGLSEKKSKSQPIDCTEICADDVQPKRTFIHKCVDALHYGFVDLVSSIGGWLVTGLVIAALITVYVPSDFFTVLGSVPILSMLVVLLVAVPMYVCATGSIPIAMSLVLKGLSPGTALVLLMAGPAANFASFTLISREMGKRAAAIYLASIVFGAMAFGLAIDYLLPHNWFDIVFHHGGCIHGTGEVDIFDAGCSALLVALLLFAFAKRFFVKHNISGEMTKEYIVKGMNCPHCQATVVKAISAVDGVTQVDVNLSTGVAVVEGEHDADKVAQAVRSAGFDLAE